MENEEAVRTYEFIFGQILNCEEIPKIVKMIKITKCHCKRCARLFILEITYVSLFCQTNVFIIFESYKGNDHYIIFSAHKIILYNALLNNNDITFNHFNNVHNFSAQTMKYST